MQPNDGAHGANDDNLVLVPHGSSEQKDLFNRFRCKGDVYDYLKKISVSTPRLGNHSTPRFNVRTR